ncbi:hypothetical protein DMB66_23185 [Actinoplanes sp. ATCC 53533]|nr:hypothetical protein DMB66_23185 [Actinoplanes sp. ATCC 53533]
MDVLATGAGSGRKVRRVQISDVLREAAYTDSGGSWGISVCQGVELEVVVAAGESAAVLSCYATSLDRMDVAGLGRDGALLAGGLQPSSAAFHGEEVTFLPSATAQLLRAIVSSLLRNPMPEGLPDGLEILECGREIDGWSTHAFDCEGTPTGTRELVTRRGQQNPTVTRLGSTAGDGAGDRLTGSAVWDAGYGYPQVGVTNVRLGPTATGADFWAGDRCVVVDAQPLGVENHRSSGHLAFRLRAVRAVDGELAESYLPLILDGDPARILGAVRAVGDVVTYHPGLYSVGGSPLTMSLASS